MHITSQGCRLRNDLYCVEWDVKLYYTIPLCGIQTTVVFVLTAAESSTEESGLAQLEREVMLVEEAAVEDRQEQVRLTFGLYITSLFFQRLLQVRPGPEGLQWKTFGDC